MTTPTRLGGALAGAAPKAPASSAFQRAIAGASVFEPYELLLPNDVRVPCSMTLVGSETLLDIEGRVTAAMERRSLKADVITQGNFEMQRAIYTLALAVREPKTDAVPNPPPLGTVEEWGQLSPETIDAAWKRFGHLREENDPLADDVKLSSLEVLEIREAIAKKNYRLLRYFGPARLTAYLLTTASPPAPSTTPE